MPPLQREREKAKACDLPDQGIPSEQWKAKDKILKLLELLYILNKRGFEIISIHQDCQRKERYLLSTTNHSVIFQIPTKE